MTAHFRDLLFTDEVRAFQTKMGSRKAYTISEDELTDHADVIGENEAMFITTRDSFYLSSIGTNGWPYIQHRGGPVGFVKILNERQIGFADYRGNRQYISVGNIATENRVSLFFMDYPRQARLKLLGRMKTIGLAEDANLAKQLIDEAYKAKPERGLIIDVEAFDWNCSQHITPRFTKEDVQSVIVQLQSRIAQLESENAKLKEED